VRRALRPAAASPSVKSKRLVGLDEEAGGKARLQGIRTRGEVARPNEPTVCFYHELRDTNVSQFTDG
jgi:hypothetical protein